VGTNSRVLSLLLIQVLLIAFAIYVGVSDSAFPGAPTVARVGLVVLSIAVCFLAGEVARISTHFRALLGALQQQTAAATPRNDREAVDVLVAALGSANGDTRDMAWKNLRRITGQDLPLDEARWKEWWAGAREGFSRGR
jgi:hypothetical protein